MSSKPKKPKPISQRALARRLGVTHGAVGKAIAAGRLEGALVLVDGVAKVADPELAAKLFEAARRPKVDDTRPLELEQIDYRVARARHELAKARLAELDVAEREGAVAPIDEVRREVVNDYTIVRNKLLGVPTRCKQRIPTLTLDQVAIIDDLIRQALEELAAD